MLVGFKGLGGNKTLRKGRGVNGITRMVIEWGLALEIRPNLCLVARIASRCALCAHRIVRRVAHCHSMGFWVSLHCVARRVVPVGWKIVNVFVFHCA